MIDQKQAADFLLRGSIWLVRGQARVLAVCLILVLFALPVESKQDMSADAAIKRSHQLADSGKRMEAIKVLTTYLSAKPHDARVLVQRGFLYNEFTDFSKCKKDLTDALTYSGGGKNLDYLQQIYIVRAYACSCLKQRSALADVEKAIQIDPRNPEAYHIGGSVKQNLGMFLEALADVEQSLKMAPHQELCLNQAIDLTGKLKIDAKHRKYLFMRADLFPTVTNLRERMAYCVRKGLWKPAYADSLKLLPLCPNDVDLRVSSIEFLMNMQRYNGAYDAAKTARNLFPDNVELLVKEADALSMLDRFDDAMPLYKKLSQNPAKAAHAHEQMAYILRRQQRFESSLEELKKASKFREHNVPVLHTRAQSNRMAEQYRDAANDYTRLYQLTSRRCFIVDAAECYNSNGDYKRALATFAIALDPKGPGEPFDKLSLCHVFSGQALANLRLDHFQEARACATRALTTDPNLFAAYIIRSQANVKLNLIDDAIKDLSESIRLSPDFALCYAERAKLYDRKNLTALAEKDRKTLKRLSRGLETDFFPNP